MKQAGERITMLTAYDATFARLLDRAGTDVLLVGDSLGMVVQGHDTTLPVTMDQMVYHCAAVKRGVQRAHLVADMPFGSYQGTADEAVKNAVRLVAEGGAESVKLEGGAEYVDVVQRIERAGCDGQVLVIYDLLGMNPDFSPKFVKKYLDLGVLIRDAVGRYNDDVKHGTFPGPEHSFSAEKEAGKSAPVLQLYSSV